MNGDFDGLPLTETNLRALVRDEMDHSTQILTNKTMSAPSPESKPAVWSADSGLYLVENYNSGLENLKVKHITCESLEVTNPSRMVFLEPGASFHIPLQGGGIQIICRDVPTPPAPMAVIDSSVAWPFWVGIWSLLFIRW